MYKSYNTYLFFQEVLAFSHGIHEQVIHATPVRVAHDAIVYLTIGSVSDIVSEDVVDKFLCIGAAHEDFAHVRHVEHAARLAHGIMFLLDA